MKPPATYIVGGRARVSAVAGGDIAPMGWEGDGDGDEGCSQKRRAVVDEYAVGVVGDRSRGANRIEDGRIHEYTPSPSLELMRDAHARLSHSQSKYIILVASPRLPGPGC